MLFCLPLTSISSALPNKIMAATILTEANIVNMNARPVCMDMLNITNDHSPTLQFACAH